MLDNWTKEQLFEQFFLKGIEQVAAVNGRLAITDDADLEKAYDQYVRARDELFDRWIKWSKEVE